MSFYDKTPNQTLKELKVDARNGLSSSDVRQRLKEYGRNEIVVAVEPLWRKLLEPFRSLMMFVLALAAGISVWHGATFDAIVIGVIMLISAVIYYAQRFTTERVLRALQKRNTSVVDVRRDGETHQIEAEQLVPGDIVFLHEGEKVPADVRLIVAHSLRVDESQLTGESLPINKSIDVLSGTKEIYDQSNMLFQGSFAISGEAEAVVVATGNTTEFGKLAQLSSEPSDKSPVQEKIDNLLRQIIIVIAAVSLVAFALAVYRGMEFVEALRFVIAVAVSAVPEGLPVAISVVLVLGMRRMATKKALVRTMSAIETIGTVTTIATDKTGTLTLNKLTVQETWVPQLSLPDFKRLVARTINVRSAKLHDPLDTALQDFTVNERFHAKPLITLPFNQETAMSGNIWHNGDLFTLYVKGAPERLLERSRLAKKELAAAHEELLRLTKQGLRVIAIAHTELKKPLEDLSELSDVTKIQFDGFVGVVDILRTEAKASIEAAQAAGVTVRMITGDHVETAYQIGKKLGLVTARDQVFDSRQMGTMTDKQLTKTIDSVLVFARVLPEHKHRILSILKEKHITAMTGDGVNDVPALVNAHVGLAMGSGTQIARDAGDIVLVNDNFASIVDAIHEGRTIYANIKRMLYYLMSTSTGEVLATVGALAIGMPAPLVPIQILWVNLVTDTALVIPLGLEPGEKRNMLRPPQRPNAPLLSKFMISRMVLVALAMAVVTLGFYAWYAERYDHAYAQTIAFTALVVMQWASALSARSDYEPVTRRIFRINGAFLVGLFCAIALQFAALFTPLASVLHVTPVAMNDLLVTSVISFFALLVLAEIHKLIGRFFFSKGSSPLR